MINKLRIIKNIILYNNQQELRAPWVVILFILTSPFIALLLIFITIENWYKKHFKN